MAASSPAKFLFGFLLVSIILWLLFVFASRLVAWLLSRIVGASVTFRVGGWKCLRDIVVKFKKGPFETICVGEIKVSLRQSLVKLGAGFFSRDPKLQVLISELEIVMRPSSTSKEKSKSRRTRNSGKGKGKVMVVANMARFLSISITDLAVKMPKATVEIKDLNVELSKDAVSKSNLSLKLHVLPIIVYLGDPQVSGEHPSSFGNEGYFYPSQTSYVSMERSTAPFSCEEFLVSCEFGHDREAGVSIKNLDISIGEVTANLNDALLSKSRTPADASSQIEIVPAVDSATSSNKQNKNQAAVTALAKYTSMIPEKVSFSLPKLDVNFVQREHNLFIENNIMGIQLRCVKSRSSEDVGESTRLDIQIDFSEIHLLRESTTSIIEILKLDVASLVHIPVEPTLPVRAEVDVKLGGTQFNLLMSRLKPWLHLQLSKKKKMVLHEGTAVSDRSTSVEPKLIMWTCTVSAPEMTLVLYSINDLPLYLSCSQSLHIFANNISNSGTAVHLELGELNLYVEDEYQDCLKEIFFGVEANSGSFMHVAKVSLDWGKKDVEGMEEDVSRSKLALSVDVTGVGISFTFKRVELLISTALSFQAFLKNLSSSRKKAVQSHGSRASSSGKGTRLLKFNLERCSIILCGEAGLENSSVADPKRVNYGSQGGKMVISVSADGTPRTASIMSRVSEQYKKLKYSVSLDIFHLTVCVNKEKQSTQLELERARLVYEDFLTEHKSGEKVTIFDMQNAKLVRRAGCHKEISLCSLFSAADITVRWEPDLHLSLVELGLHLKSLIQKKKLEKLSDMNLQDVPTVANVDQGKEMTKDSGQNVKNKKKESIFAVDIETLTISAEAGDGVEALVQVQSIFSENAQIGVLLEGLVLSFNGVRVLKSSRMQVSRIPRSSTSSSDAKLPGITTWDWTLQGLDIHVSMPYRLQLRAIDDSFEDMLRAVKLITASKTKLFFPSMTESGKPKKPSSMKLGCIKICVRKLTADIEEEPMQGWLDEHYQLLKNEACELAVRLKYFDDILKGNQHTGSTDANDFTSQKKFSYDGLGVDFQDPSSIGKIQEELHRQSFRSYYHACQNLRPSEGSGAYKTGFQAGFRPSASRTSLLSISASELDLTLTSIKGGDDGMIKLLGKLDPISHEYSIPFSRLYGSNILLRTSSLAVQIRDYTYPLFSATSGKCEGCVILAQQATYFQPQVYQDVYVGKWRKVQLLRSASGTTPPLKTYLDLPIYFQKGEISFGVGYEPSFADIGYAFTVALRRANLSVRNPDPNWTSPPKKEKSLPWWDDMRQYMHGNISLLFNETRWYMLATTDPYEKLDKLQFVSSHMEIQQSDGRVYLSAKDFKIFISSLESLGKNRSLKLPMGVCDAFLETPEFVLEVLIDWDCVSGNPLNHYLFAFPNEGKTREIVLDPYRSTSLSLRWNILAKPVASSSSVGDVGVSDTLFDSHNSEGFWPFTPTFSVGAHDLAWITKFWMLNYAPPHKLRSFSRFPRFGVPRFPRSGNLSLDRVLTEFMLRIDVTPACVKHVALFDDDPAKGLTFRMTKLKYEMYQSRGKQKFTFDCKREPLDMVYRGFDIYMLRAFLAKASENQSIMSRIGQTSRKPSQSALVNRVLSEKGTFLSSCTEKNCDDGFLLSSDYFTIRKQAPKADPARLLAWQEAGRRNVEMTYVRSEFENGSESDEHARSDQSDDDGYNVVIADNCQRVFVYGLKLLWTIENRDAVWSWVGGLAKAFESPKPSPSLLYAQRKLHQQNEGHGDEVLQNDKTALTAINPSSSSPSMQNDKISVLAAIPASSSPPVQNGKPKAAAANHYASSSSTVQNDKSKAAAADTGSSSPLVRHAVNSGVISSPSHKFKMENAASIAVAKNSMDDPEEEGTRNFMVNVIKPQFNLHSEEANGRFLLAAVSGRVLARSFHSVLHVGLEMIEKALGTGEALGTRNAPATGDAPIRESLPEMMWKRMELSVMLEHVQAHVAPTDVDPGAGLQWLPKISRNSAKVKRTGALLERVFMPCDMYFQYTRHKGGTPDLKMKPLKELAFNSHDITATMTSRQFQVMLDVLTNLLFARLPKPRRSSLTYPVDDDEDVEEEADEVVPYGVEEVELAKINLEKKDREQKLLIDDIRKLSHCYDAGDSYREEGDLWMIHGGKYALVKELKRELAYIHKCRKEASSALRMALQKAAQLRLMEKEKNKSPSYAMRISLQITKVVWGMLIDGKPFAEAEINDLIYDFDRDYKDVGVALFTTKSIVVRNCLPNAKSDMLLSAWNPPPEWGKKLMLRVDAKQGAPKDGHSPLELFQVEIYPLKIHLTETMYRMMWEYLFPTEEQDSQRRQEVWKISTTAGSKRVKKGSTLPEASTSFGPSTKESEVTVRLPNTKTNIVSGLAPELRRTSSFDRSWEDTVAESVANELVLQAHSSSRIGPLGCAEQADESFKKKDSRTVKSGRTSYEDKKVGKAIEEKRSRPRKLMEFHNIKISQVELCVTYEGSRFVVNDLKLLMDTFHRDEFIGTWRRLFSRVKKHIIWGVLKSVTGMQGKKFKDKGHNSKETIAAAVPDSELNFSDNEGGPTTEKNDQFPIAFTKRKEDVAGDGFVTSIRGLFNTQRRRAKKFVLRTMRGEENDYEWSESDAESSPFARQLTITKAKKLIRRHTKKFRNKGTKGSSSSQQKEDLPPSPMDPGFESDSSGGGSSLFEDFHEELNNAN